MDRMPECLAGRVAAERHTFYSNANNSCGRVAKERPKGGKRGQNHTNEAVPKNLYQYTPAPSVAVETYPGCAWAGSEAAKNTEMFRSATVARANAVHRLNLCGRTPCLCDSAIWNPNKSLLAAGTGIWPLRKLQALYHTRPGHRPRAIIAGQSSGSI